MVAHELVTKGRFYLDEFSGFLEKRADINQTISTGSINVLQKGDYFAPEVNGHRISVNPIAVSILAMAPYTLTTFLISASNTLQITAIFTAANIVGSLFSAFAICVMLFVLRKINEKSADYIIVVYAIGTLIVPIAGTLNNHLLGLIFLPLAWYFAIKDKSDVAGFFGALAAAGRYTNLVSWVVLAMYIATTRKKIVHFLLASLPIFILLLWYNTLAFGSAFDTGNNHIYLKEDGTYATLKDLFVFDLSFVLNAFLAQLISPNRGIFVFSPFLIFALFGVKKAFSEKNELAITMRFIILAFVGTILFFSSWIFWTGGYRYGYIIALDTIVYLVLLLTYGSDSIFSNKLLLILFATTAVLSILIAINGQSTGCDWAYIPNSIDEHKERVWDINDLQITRCFTENRVPFMIKMDA